MMTQLNDKIVLITGGAMGIGAATARLLSGKGATVIVTDINAEAGQQLADTILEQGNHAQFMPLNATSEQEWERLTKRCISEFGGLDILVNNAGIFRAKPIESTSLKEWHQVMDTNTDSVFLGLKYGVHAINQRSKERQAGYGGSIINVASISAKSGTPCALAYTASKAAVTHMTKSAAMEFSALGYNIRVNAVLPGMVQTPMLEGLIKDMAGLGAFGTEDPQQLEQVAASMHPIGRFADPLEIAKGILFLASDNSSYMTGSELIIDGGYIAR